MRRLPAAGCRWWPCGRACTAAWCAAPLAGLLEGFGIARFLGTRFGDMSLGTRKKFMLASGLMGDARVVLMDEPTNGIDADAKGFLVELVRREREGRLLLFSTHDAELVAHTGADRLALSAAAGATA